MAETNWYELTTVLISHTYAWLREAEENGGVKFSLETREEGDLAFVVVSHHPIYLTGNELN